MELGWVIGRKYWGKGYTPEVATKVLDILFDEVGANCVYAGHHVENLTPEAVEQGSALIRPDAKVYVVDDAELARVKASYPVMWKRPRKMFLISPFFQRPITLI